MKKKTTYQISAIAMAFVLSLTGGQKKNENKAEVENTKIQTECLKEEIEELNRIHEEWELKIELKKIIESPSIEKAAEILSTHTNLSIYYIEMTDELLISGSGNNSIQLTDFFYECFNLLIQKGNITRFSFNELDNQFDFSKIDFSQIKGISLTNCYGTITFPENTFLTIENISFENCLGRFEGIDYTKKYNVLKFYNTSFEIAEPFLLHGDISETQITWSENNEKSKELKRFLNCLIENNISLEWLSINEEKKENNQGITQEDFTLISQLNARYIGIQGDGFTNPVHLELFLNKKIQEIHFSLYGMDSKNGELGTININTDTEEFYCIFTDMNITQNTSFSLPDSSRISLQSFDCSDISAFHDLSNVTYLSILEDSGPGPQADLSDLILYCKDPQPRDYEVFFLTEKEVFTNYNKMLIYLYNRRKMFIELLKVQKQLNISSEEENRYQKTFSIGDIVIVISDDAFLYSDIYSSKKLSPYYGKLTLRCISAIILEKNGQKIKVDNMEDYEYYKSEGFKEIRYQLVNPYSLNKDGSLTVEGQYEIEKLEFARNLFK